MHFLCENFTNDDSAIITRRKFSHNHDLRDISQAPSVSIIRKWVSKFEETVSIMDQDVTKI